MRKLLLTKFLVLAFLFTLHAQDNLFPDGKAFYDTYHHVAGIEDSSLWNLYNVHDPSVNKDGDYYYMYGTDASWGGAAHNGAMKRRSKDLVNWEYLGNAFNGVPESAQTWFKTHGNPDYTDNGVWAPFLFKLRDKYILYYSAPGGLDGTTFAYLGYATSESANGPWDDQGVITTAGFYNESTGTVTSDTINAIDPTVVFDSTTHKLWMAYGSWHTGIYIVEMDTVTGGLKYEGDRGKRIANRKNTGYGQEGPELSFHNGYYYLFQSYDGLGDLYNVRVGRATSPDGPYYDFFGNELTNQADNYPMVLAPYTFNDNYGWQGTGHCGVYNDNGQYYMFQQGRPTVVPSMMVGQVRKIFWIDNWPVVSPERYAGVTQPTATTIDVADLTGDWENIDLEYKTSSNFLSTSDDFAFNNDGSFSGGINGTWSLTNDTLSLVMNDGTHSKCVVYYGWDWEYDCKTLLYTGLSDEGTCVWGKKVYADTVESISSIVDGATYTIRSAYSHMLVGTPGNGSCITQALDVVKDSQLWTARNAGSGYFYLLPRSANQAEALKVQSSSNGAYFVVDDTTAITDKFKFNIQYQKNGYYAVLTRASDDVKGFDLWGYSVDEGGTIQQYTFDEDGWHQYWQFERVDSIPLDFTATLDTITEPVEEDELPTVYEPFDYEQDNLSGAGITGGAWSGSWIVSTDDSYYELTDGLTYDNLATSGKSLSITCSGASAGDIAYRKLANTYENDGSTYWISFLCQITNSTGGNYSWQGISLNLDDTEEFYLGKIYGVSNMGINDPDPYLNSSSDYEYTDGLAWYVVCVKTTGGVGTDTAYMWINPDATTEPNISEADVTSLADISDGFNRIRMHLGNTAGIVLNVDEFRIAYSFASMLTCDAKSELAKNNYDLNIYPNPINETATISYSLQNGSNVSLDIYNQIGAKVASVISNDYQSAGTYTTQWDASNLSTGIYIYKLSVEGEITVRKFIKQ